MRGSQPSSTMDISFHSREINAKGQKSCSIIMAGACIKLFIDMILFYHQSTCAGRTEP